MGDITSPVGASVSFLPFVRDYSMPLCCEASVRQVICLAENPGHRSPF